MALVRNIILFCTGLFLATMLSEAFLRLSEASPWWRVLPVAQISLYGPDENAGYTHRPNLRGIWTTENRAHVETSALGFRGHDVSHADIVVAGDSITEALQVEETKTFVYLAGQATGKEIVNLGLAGATPAVWASRLEHFIPILKPEMAVIVTDEAMLQSDKVLEDNAWVGYKITADGNAATRSYGFRTTKIFRLRTSPVGKMIYWAIDHIRVMSVLNLRLNRGLSDNGSDKGDVSGKLAVKTCTMDAFLALWKDGTPPNQHLALEAFLADLETLQKKQNVRVILALTGPWQDCDTPQQEEARKILAEAAHRHNIVIADFSRLVNQSLPAGVTRRQLKGFGIHTGYGHLNETGHIVYASALAALVRREEITNSPGSP